MNNHIPIIGQTDQDKFNKLSAQEKYDLAANALKEEDLKNQALLNILGSQHESLAKALEFKLSLPEEGKAREEFKKMLGMVATLQDSVVPFHRMNVAIGFGIGLVTAGVIWWLL